MNSYVVYSIKISDWSVLDVWYVLVSLTNTCLHYIQLFMWLDMWLRFID